MYSSANGRYAGSSGHGIKEISITLSKIIIPNIRNKESL